ncbi:MAG: NAD(+) synthase [Myxococcales bacterium]|nr:NAD(+) synthase [Myxococcales bacterium]
MANGFLRASAGVPQTRVGDVEFNCERLLELWTKADEIGSALVVFPELSVTGYTSRDLFLNEHLLASGLSALVKLAKAACKLNPMAFIGLPIKHHLGIFNCVAAVHKGQILGLCPKSYLPNYGEFEEERWFRSGRLVRPNTTIRVADTDVPFGLDILFKASNAPDLVVGVEVCEDNWVHVPPSLDQISAGALIICNLSASNFVVGKADTRRILTRAHSIRGKCAYIYVAAGPGESSTDLAFDSDAFICEQGAILAQSKRFSRSDQLVTSEIDLNALMHSRMASNTFGECSAESRQTFRYIPFTLRECQQQMRPVDPHPFLPKDPNTLATRCWEVFEIQSNALATRMRAIGSPKLILGISGGLDSTHAALVATQAIKLCGQVSTDLVCVTMPGLGTTSHTKDNAISLAEQLGADLRTMDIKEESLSLLKAIEHPAASQADDIDALIKALRQNEQWANVTVENVQARLRTLILMSLANQENGIVVGTGDLSEKALGWSTYAGDQIAMYDVNAGVPKTLIQFVVRWVANERLRSWSTKNAKPLRETLFSILETPISPELLPASTAGQISQMTETQIGPYELHDFFLFHFVGHGRPPRQILDLAWTAFKDTYDPDTLKKWFSVFLKRFFSQQFKRSCTADGPKVLSIALSPRGDWRMPSDASVSIWLDDIENWGEST